MLDMRQNRFRKTLFFLLKRSFGFNLCKPNTSHLNYNNFNFNITVLYAYVLCFHILALSRIPDMILGDKTLISEVVLSQLALEED
jgi:hypothetical protein